MQEALDQIVREDMNIVIVGHVDHGKSTIIGRLLADTGSLPEGKLEFIKESCRRNSKPFEYAFLLDALKDEQAQGITIDAARCFFKTKKRNYIILDAPGHIEFLKNMVTGASRAEAALLAIDAAEGIQENSKRHGYLLSMLGIRQVAVLVNKMDLVGYNEKTFNDIKKEYSEFLGRIGIEGATFLPVSGFHGDNIAFRESKNMAWYGGPSVLSMLDSFESAAPPAEMPLRMPVQQVYKFTQNGDMRRIVAGTIDTGTLKTNDKIVFYPSGKSSDVKTIEEFNAPLPDEAGPGKATGFTLRDQIYVVRGELAAKAGEPAPKVAERVKANIFWLAKQPFIMGKEYHIKLGTAKIAFELEQVIKVLNTSDLSSGEKDMVECNDAAECILSLKKPLAFDLAADNPATSRFVIVDEYEISGGGIITEALEDDAAWVRDKVITRNQRWVISEISRLDRAERYHQKASLVIITGLRNSGKKTLARALEKKLFEDGQVTYFIGMGNLLYGVDADIKKPGMNGHKPEHIRRLAEVCNLMLDAGVIVIATAIELDEADIGIMRTIVSDDDIHIIWKGDDNTTGIGCDLQFGSFGNVPEQADSIKALLRQKGTLFNPYPNMP